MISISNELGLFQEKTALKEDVDKGANTIKVLSIARFDANKILLIGSFGDEGAEIIKIHPTTAPSNNIITLVSTLIKSHSQSVQVTILDYDQIEISHSLTETGTKTLLSLETLNPENETLNFDDTSQTSGYYFVRYKNSISNDFSSYTDPIPYSGWRQNTVGYAIQYALRDTGYSLDERMDITMLFGALNRMLRNVRGRLRRWSNYQEFDYIVGALQRGDNRIKLPETIYDKNSNKSILSVKIDEKKLSYIDKQAYDTQIGTNTQIKISASIGDTSIVLENTNDLDDDGTITVYNNNIRYSITYTTNDKETGTLGGIPASGDGSITVTLDVNLNVWQDESEGLPQYYTIFDGYLYIAPLTQYDNKNIMLDFYSDIDSIDSEGDILTGPRPDMAFFYLKAYMRSIKEDESEMNLNDSDYYEFNRITLEAVRKESSGQRKGRKVPINSIIYK